MDCNENFQFAEATASLDATQQLFEYAFRVERPFRWPCFIFEHVASGQGFFPCGEYPLVPTTHWKAIGARATPHGVDSIAGLKFEAKE